MLNYAIDFSKLIHCPEHTSYSHKISFRLLAPLIVVYPKRIQSSANNKCVIGKMKNKFIRIRKKMKLSKIAKLSVLVFRWVESTLFP